MRIIFKIPLLLAGFFMLYFGAMIVVERSYIRPSFESLERKASLRDLDRVLAAMNREAEHLAIISRDWSQWDDTWLFVGGAKPSYVEENLGPDGFKIIDASLVAIYDAEGRRRFAGRYDPASGMVLPDDSLPERAPLGAPYLGAGKGDSGISGVLAVGEHIYLLASTPIIRSDGSGPVRGSFIIARNVGSGFASAIAAQTSVQTVLLPVGDAPVGVDLAAIVAAGDHLVMTTGGDRSVHGWGLVRDLSGRPALLVGTLTSRDISDWSGRTIGIAGLVIIGLGIMFCVGIYLLLSRLVIEPLSAIGGSIRRFEAEGTIGMSGRVLVRPDEIGNLSRTLEHMASRIAAREAELSSINEGLEERIEKRTRDLRQANDDLRLMAKVVESTSEGVVITDLHGKILVVNDAFCGQSGYSPSELVGQDIAVMKSGRHDESFYQVLRAKLREDGTWTGEVWDRRKSGEIYPEWLSINLVRGEDDEPRCYVGVATDISRLKETEERLNHLAYYDPLTSLPNRTLFRYRLSSAIQRGQRRGHRVALLFLDLDRFKYINDAFGHDAGDRLLVEVARRIARRVRESDTVCRLGGDEFTVILEEIDRGLDAGTVARNIIAEISRPVDLKEGEVFIGASVGIAVFPDDAATAEGLTRKADAAMYQAKMAGGDTFRFVSTETEATSQARIALESDLRRGLERGEFFLVYQPIVDIIDGRILGAEALLRWRHGPGDLTLPDGFIGLAEETGIIFELGEWVMREACAAAASWRRSDEAPFVSVNISPRQFDQAGLALRVRKALEASSLRPQALVVEITESALMHDVEGALRTMCEIKNLGVRLAIDDFGTGHSSLSHLSRFPVDKLKIDQSFTRGIREAPNMASIVDAIVAMSKSLGLGTIAEGVETENQRAYLALRGCREGQGYLFSRPVELGVFRALMEAGPLCRPLAATLDDPCLRCDGTDAAPPAR